MENQKNSNVSLEWAAMFGGVLLIIITGYVIFGTDWNAYSVTNVVLGVAFIIFITYAFTNASNLKSEITEKSSRLYFVEHEFEKAKKLLSEVELELNEKTHDIQRMKGEIAELEHTVASLTVQTENQENIEE